MEFRESLHPDVQSILDYVTELTKKNFKFIKNDNLVQYARVKIARQNMESHIIVYKTEHDKLINHLIAHECGHIVRMYKTPEQLRFVPATTEKEKLNSLEPLSREIERLANKIGHEKFINILNMMYDGVVRQVTNQPIDLLIEKWIFDDYPNLRQVQLDSLLKQNSEALSGLSKEIKNLVPNIFYHAANLMNTAYTDLLSKIIKFKLNRNWKKTEFYEESKVLSSMLDVNVGWEPENDCYTIDKWAAYLKLNTFFKWHPFEILPNDYLNKY